MYIHGRDNWKMVIPEWENCDSFTFYREWMKGDVKHSECYQIYLIKFGLGKLEKFRRIEKDGKHLLRTTDIEKNGVVEDLLNVIAKDCKALSEIIEREETKEILIKKGWIIR